MAAYHRCVNPYHTYEWDPSNSKAKTQNTWGMTTMSHFPKYTVRLPKFQKRCLNAYEYTQPSDICAVTNVRSLTKTAYEVPRVADEVSISAYDLPAREACFESR